MLLPSATLAVASIGNVDRLADEGRKLFLDAARAQRVFEAARDRRLEPAQSRGVVLRLIDDAKGLVRSVTEALVARTIRLGSWFASMRATLLPRHFAAGMAVLSHADLPPADLEAIADLSRGQVGYLERFRGQIATAAQLLDGTAPARAELYASAIWSLSHNVMIDRAVRDGYREGKRILGFADHCVSCLEAARQDWLPLHQVLPIGDSICGMNCRCTVEVR